MKHHMLALGLALACSSTVLAGESPSSASGSPLLSRCTADAYADLMRDWAGRFRATATEAELAPRQIQGRDAQAAYADLMRDWEGRLSQSDQTCKSGVSIATHRTVDNVLGRS